MEKWKQLKMGNMTKMKMEQLNTYVNKWKNIKWENKTNRNNGTNRTQGQTKKCK